MNLLTEETGKFFPFFPQPFKLGLGRMLIDRDGEVRGFLAMEQHGQSLKSHTEQEKLKFAPYLAETELWKLSHYLCMSRCCPAGNTGRKNRDSDKTTIHEHPAPVLSPEHGGPCNRPALSLSTFIFPSGKQPRRGRVLWPQVSDRVGYELRQPCL